MSKFNLSENKTLEIGTFSEEDRKKPKSLLIVKTWIYKRAFQEFGLTGAVLGMGI